MDDSKNEELTSLKLSVLGYIGRFVSELAYCARGAILSALRATL